ncbi:MAG: tetratricopeptide repeat protein [Methanothrix sp.]
MVYQIEERHISTIVSIARSTGGIKIKIKLLLVSAILLQSIGFAAGQPTYHFILPPDGQKDQAFNMIVIGDSIAWGNGLNEKDKYYYLVADWLEEKLNKPIDVTVYAHSGARISESKDLLTHIIDFFSNLNPFKSKNDPNLNSPYPTLKEQADSIINADDVDLILVSGGINDVDIMNIININEPADEIRRRSESVEKNMENLLKDLLSKNKKYKIIVTTYYPIVSDDINEDPITNIVSIVAQLRGLAEHEINLMSNINQKSRLVENSYTFNGNILESLTNAVRNADNNANRIGLAMVNFPPERCYGASESWLWKLVSLSPPMTDDDQYEYRNLLCPPVNVFDVNRINAIGHPNRDGAREYARAIEAVITSKGLNWLDPKDAEFWVQKGRDLFNQSRYDESINCFDEAIKLDQTFIDAWIRKSKSIAVQDKPDEAIQCLDEALKVNPQSEKLQVAKGAILFLVSRYDEAIQCFDEAITLNQSSFEAWGSKGHVLFAQGKYDEAIQDVDEGLSINPQSLGLWELKGMTLDAQGKYDEAIQCYDEAIRIDPQEGEIWLNKGNVYMDQGNYNEAIQCYEEAIRIDPQEAIYWKNKGEALQILGRNTEANEAFIKSGELGGIKGQTIGYGQGRIQVPKLTDLTAEDSSKGQSTQAAETTQDTSVASSSSDISANSDVSETNTKTAYTKDGTIFISKERMEQNIKYGWANPGDYEEVQVSLDTIVVDASVILDED